MPRTVLDAVEGLAHIQVAIDGECQCYPYGECLGGGHNGVDKVEGDLVEVD